MNIEDQNPTTDQMLTPARRTRFVPHSAFEYTLDELTTWSDARGLPKFRAKQLYNWLYRHHACDYDEMTVLPAPLRAQLAAELPVAALTPVRELHTDDDETVKVLFRTTDGQ